ncbi:DeoR family transcriptional regulator [Kineococcus aurantiacus]|uniref:DeoR family transcriptional regulator of aga operon n=1 Tax=Kineococcus aurantiacus TaxID=37633 RepID=A0A7Y9AS98_9ACTN|nr:DeoR family transcriptional regulator of aga operon [Kineococcus aurantiacus]
MTTPPLPHAGSGKRSRRLVAVLRLLGEQETVGLHRFVDELGVSVATVRRDLADLEAQGLLTRTHGGARTAASAVEVPVRLRAGTSHHLKQLIARRAATFLPEGPYAVAIGGGTTAAEVARALRFRPDLTIVTNSLTTAGEIGSRPNLRVLMTGGVVRPHSFELVGVLAENTFTALNVGTAFLGADGLSAAGGVTTHDETEARTNAAMIRSAQRTVVVADSSKVGRVTLARVAALDGIDDVVTDEHADEAELERLRAAGPRVHVVGDRDRVGVPPAE